MQMFYSIVNNYHRMGNKIKQLIAIINDWMNECETWKLCRTMAHCGRKQKFVPRVFILESISCFFPFDASNNCKVFKSTSSTNKTLSQ